MARIRESVPKTITQRVSILFLHPRIRAWMVVLTGHPLYLVVAISLSLCYSGQQTSRGVPADEAQGGAAHAW